VHWFAGIIMQLSFDQLIDEVVANGKYQIVIVFIIMTQTFGGAYLNTGAVFLGKFFKGISSLR